MKIAWIVPGGVDESGVERVIPALLWQIERLAARHELHVFALRQHAAQREYQLLGATVHSLAAAGALSTWLALEHELDAAGPFDVVHAFWAGLPGLLGGLAGWRRRRPVLVTVAGGEFVACPEIGYGGQLRWANRATIATSMKLATRSTVATRFIKAQLADLRRSDPGMRSQFHAASDAAPPVDLVPLGVPRDLFTPPPEPPPRPWRLLHVGSLNRVKDQRTLLAALAIIVKREPEVRLDVIGEDTLGGEIAREADARQLTPFVRFHGWQPSSAMPAWYRRAHLLIVSSRHESGPVAALEAAACGTPTVGTRVGHVADWAPTLASAVPVGDPGAISESVFDLLYEEVRRRQMAAAVRAFALEHDADWTAARFGRLYDELAR